MASIYGHPSTEDERSGGKIARRKRVAARKTPYDKPIPAPPPPTRSPNWLTGVIFPATRMLATGAGKLISSVFTDASSSSSSSSSGDSASEDHVDDDNDIDVAADEIDGLNENGNLSGMLKYSGKEPQLTPGKVQNKHVIEQLIMQETFSRDECDRLMRIIRSRVVDFSTMKAGQYRGLSERASPTAGNDTAGLCTKAVREAQKWFEEKKMDSSSKSDVDRGIRAYNSFLLPNVVDGDVNSPVDVAKSYMRARPTWASPSVEHAGIRTPSPMATELFKEETPYSIGGSSLSPSKKRDSLAIGSWNLQEEIRRVRSKATEDMLRPLPSTKIDLSSYALESKATLYSLVADNVVDVGYKMHKSNSLTATKPTEASANMATGADTGHDVPVLEKTQGSSRNEALSSDPAIFIFEQNQDLETDQIVEGGGASRTHKATSPEGASKQQTDLRSSDGDYSTAKEVIDFSGTPNINGFPSSNFSLSAGLDTKQNSRQPDGENANGMSSGQDKPANSVPVEENCNLLSEASIEVPIVDETTSFASGSQNTYRMHHDEPSPELAHVDSTRSLEEKTGGMVEKKPAVRKSNRYNKRGGGKGK